MFFSTTWAGDSNWRLSFARLQYKLQLVDVQRLVLVFALNGDKVNTNSAPCRIRRLDNKINFRFRRFEIKHCISAWRKLLLSNLQFKP